MHPGKKALEKLENGKFGEPCDISNFEAMHILDYVATLKKYADEMFERANTAENTIAEMQAEIEGWKGLEQNR